MRWLESIGVYRTAPDPRPRSVIESELDAELEHHLACTREELLASGLDPKEAEQEARRRFGNPTRIRRECLHVRMGERVMLQRFHFAATSVFALACLWLGYENRSLRVQSAQAMDEMFAAVDQLQEKLHFSDDPETPPVPEEIVIRVGDRLMPVGPGGELIEWLGVAKDGMALVDHEWVHLAGKTREEAEVLLGEIYSMSRAYIEPGSVRVFVVPPTTESTPEPGPQDSREVILRSGDRLTVRGPNGKVLEQLLVQEDGQVLVNGKTWVRVAGKTRAEAEALLVVSYNDRITKSHPDYYIRRVRVEVLR